MANTRKAIALVSGSFTGKITQRRYFLQAGKEVEEQVPGDFEGVTDTYVELQEPAEPVQEEPAKKPAAKKGK